MRCLTLANALADRGWGCAFACTPQTPRTVPALAGSGHELAVSDHWSAQTLNARWPEGCTVLVIDHYGLDAMFERACRPWAGHILVIDDLANRLHDADTLLDQTFGRDAADYRALLPDRARILTGSCYALLRPEFAARRDTTLHRRAGTTTVERILVSMGMGDPDNATAKVLEGVASSGLPVSVDILLGAAAPHLDAVRQLCATMPQRATLTCDAADMAERMAAADLTVGAGGTTSWERCCLGLPTLALVTADNQDKITRELDRAGALWRIGRHPHLDATSIANAIRSLASDGARRAAMAQTAAALCDGLGTDRVLKELLP